MNKTVRENMQRVPDEYGLLCRLIEHGLTSPPTQYRLYGRRFYRSKDPTNSIKVLKEHTEYTINTKTISTHTNTKAQQVP